ncbi:chaperonin 10-like protein [Lasiosphaeris hirsuta]|uniref:Chaperonin 10-like protein n=1 Tax=Lasiosphaeris hirsuta TaxID=260670 RepID=A0AA39ZRA5_9PEZI|nr:chaperonin 10-like protein [Lasiosphaeris hirsuta]
MKALVYTAKGKVELQDRPKPTLQFPSDAIVKLVKSTICGTDLHIRKGEVATCTPGRVLGHGGVGVIESVGTSVPSLRPGHRVVISCISSCATCFKYEQTEGAYQIFGQAAQHSALKVNS